MGYIGNHLSITNGYPAMVEEEIQLGGNTFAFFTRNPRGGKNRTPSKEELQKFNQLLEENRFGTLVAHGAYTMNVCSANETTRQNGYEMLVQDLRLMSAIPHAYYNFHPGSHTGQGSEVTIPMIADAVNRAREESGNHTTILLLETMAGKGSEVGRNFEELHDILNLLYDKDHAGVCFDTCHTWDGGYDLSCFDEVLQEFDQVIGLPYLYAVHLNDSKNVCGAHKDRHEKLGEGMIGSAILKQVVQHPALKDKPFILETPNDDEGYAEEIATVKEWMKQV